ncbi:MAG: NADH-quinone oxidoreductase subunit I [Deltaproteobacteria bacterium]|nr:MAG: NADH-quinone oxidoreductase subunit I [Deltaproteobacteria bacterium]
MEWGIVSRLAKNLFSKPMTVRFPFEAIPIAEGYRGEHHYDIDKCISCGLCAKICPNRVIEMIEAPEAYREKYPKKYAKIDLGKCCFCALCQDICPKGAIKLTKNVFLGTFDRMVSIKYPSFPEEVKSDVAQNST